MKCQFCGTNDRAGRNCDRCGGELPAAQKKLDWKSEPFFYNGYICYCLTHCETDHREVQFWLGMELVERISIPHEFLRERIGDAYDYMPFFWDLFLVAHGEKEVMEWAERNKKHPASFLLTRQENSELANMRSLSMRDLANAVKL